MNDSRNFSQSARLPLACLPLLIAIVVSWLPYLPVLSHDLSFGDEGVVAQGAYRVFSGDVPFKDFFSGLTPGSFYFYAFLFKLFGPTFLTMRLGVVAVSACLIISLWMIQSRFSVRSLLPYSMLALFLAYFGGPVWFVASHHWLSTLLCMLSLYCLIPAPQLRMVTLSSAITAGCFSAAAAFTLQHRGALWIILASLAILLLPKENRFKVLGAYWGGIVVFTLPLTIYCIVTAGWDTIYYDLVSFPLQQYGKLEGHSGIDVHPLELLQRYLASWSVVSRPGGLSQIAVWSFGLAGMYFVYAAPLLALVSLFLIRSNAHVCRYQLGLLGGALVASYLSTLHRLSDTTLFFAAPPAILIIALALSNALESDLTRTKKLSKMLLIGLSALFFFTAAGYSYLMLTRPASTFETPAGKVKTIFPEETSTLKTVTAFSQRFIRPGDSVFCYPYNPIHYFLFRFKNPSRYDTLTYPMYTLKQLAEVRENLEKQGSRWVIVDSYQKKELDREIPLEGYLMQNYIVRASAPYATILERRQ